MALSVLCFHVAPVEQCVTAHPFADSKSGNRRYRFGLSVMLNDIDRTEKRAPLPEPEPKPEPHNSRRIVLTVVLVVVVFCLAVMLREIVFVQGYFCVLLMSFPNQSYGTLAGSSAKILAPYSCLKIQNELKSCRLRASESEVQTIRGKYRGG